MSKTSAILALFAFLAMILAIPSSAAAQETVTIPVGDIWFCDPSFENEVCTTKVNVGDTVLWDFSPAAIKHTTTEGCAKCLYPRAPFWDSGLVQPGGTFSFTFPQPGTYQYYCAVHPFHLGQIVVNPSVGGIVELPDVAGQPAETRDAPDSDVGLLAGLAIAAAGAIGLIGAAWYARRRWGR